MILGLWVSRIHQVINFFLLIVTTRGFQMSLPSLLPKCGKIHYRHSLSILGPCHNLNICGKNLQGWNPSRRPPREDCPWIPLLLPQRPGRWPTMGTGRRTGWDTALAAPLCSCLTAAWSPIRLSLSGLILPTFNMGQSPVSPTSQTIWSCQVLLQAGVDHSQQAQGLLQISKIQDIYF